MRCCQCLFCCHADADVLHVDDTGKTRSGFQLLDVLLVALQAVVCNVIGNEQLALRESAQFCNCGRCEVGQKGNCYGLVGQCGKICNSPFC